MGLTIKRVADEFSSHMTAIQDLYNEAKRDNSIKRASCEAELERTKIKLRETEKKLQETEKKYDDLLQEIRSVFSLVKENLSKDVDTIDESSVDSEDHDDFPAFDDEDDEDEDDNFPADDDDIDEAEWV